MPPPKKSPRLKNPEPAADPDYPIAAWIDAETAERFRTVTVRLDDGRWLSVIDTDTAIRATGQTKTQAEKSAIRAYLDARARIPNPAEEEEEYARHLESRHQERPRVSWKSLKRSSGLR